jgi:hypothetical protein
MYVVVIHAILSFSILLSDISKAGRNIGSARIELHRIDYAASRTRVGDKSYLFID